MKIFDRNFGEIFSAQLFSIFGGLIAGIILAVYTDKIFLVPGILIIFPGFLEMRGNISGSLASRLSSGLFLGVINPDKVNTGIIKGNLLASFALVLIVSLVLGLLAFIFNFFVFKLATPEIILIPIVAGIIANTIEIPFTLFATIKLFKRGHDPNNIMGPIVTSTGDVTSILALIVAMAVI